MTFNLHWNSRDHLFNMAYPHAEYKIPQKLHLAYYVYKQKCHKHTHTHTQHNCIDSFWQQGINNAQITWCFWIPFCQEKYIFILQAKYLNM